MKKVIILIVYADVLIFLNTLVDYFLLLAVSKITNENPKTFCMVLASFLGGITSLYIFLPNSTDLLEFLYKSASAFLITAVCFGFKSFKLYLRNTGVFFLTTCAYAGVMFAFWLVFKPPQMVVNNSVVYFNISPLILTLCSVFGYILFSILWKILGKTAKYCEKCEVQVCADGKCINLKAIVDTGNSIEDFFEKGEIIITTKAQVERLFGETDYTKSNKLKRRFRVLPCTTVSGFNTLVGFRCDSAIVESEGKKITLKKPLLAISKTDFNDDYNAIINPKILR